MLDGVTVPDATGSVPVCPDRTELEEGVAVPDCPDGVAVPDRDDGVPV